ncbi:MAG: ShlB/FhaC/HecB family hemolysin secretion/activation protein [Chthoniobacter sp.]
MVHEDKPISIYASTMNSGTPSTGIWRTRLGVEWKQLLSLDDVLRAEYVGRASLRLLCGAAFL